jgi:exocyst complex component 8
LRNVKNRASTDLQRNVSQNRTQFIKISKEAERLKGEMQTLQGLMNELSVTLEQAAAASGVNRDDGVRKRNNRSSVANLEAMWSTQLQALWKHIEGSQKFVAAIPGRHVVLEMGGWIELDAATWKPKRPAHLVLLNDNLLVALRKRKRIDPSLAEQGQKAPTKLVAERCWPLQDIDLIDLESGAKEIQGPLRQYAQITGAFAVRYGQESFTYRSENPNGKHKSDFMLSFKRAVDELRRTERTENETSKPAEAMSYLATRDSAVSKNSGLLRSLSKSKDRPEMLIDVDGKQRNMRWVESQIDELDIEVALQRFDEAVAHVEFLRGIAKGLKNNAIAQDLITVKVNERASKLAGKFPIRDL